MIELEKFTQKNIPELLSQLEGQDIRFLYQFGGINYKFPLDSNQIIQTMESRSNLLFNVLDNNGKSIGHCQIIRLDQKNRKASIGRLLIYKEYRSKGYGKLMIQGLLGFAKSIGLQYITLRVFDFNISAIKCYENMGFKKIFEEYLDIKDLEEKWKIISMEIEI
ncbi:GNAT family N-acetyltransferase [Francisella sp. SYW-9]|uniref:GNAT family N-acetyltransferase n=1 Tax=Francisella sp. SYW-9 TaxID=2610888 RepID=UPI00123D20C1|nr:GNAT family N-acetyltransferase [Francisella sp. SYW-9]